MLVEDWVEHIKNTLGPSAFKDVALAALRVHYGRPVVLTDGTGDDGVDAWIQFSTGDVPVQFHAGTSEPWYDKLTGDIKGSATIRTHSSRRLFFVCAQTPKPEAQQAKLAKIEKDYGLQVTLIDARGIASVAHEREVLAALSRTVGAVLGAPPERRPNAAQEARLAFALFHEKGGDFRAEVLRSVLAACLHHATEPVPVEALLDQAIATVGGARALRRAFRQELDSLTQDGSATLDARGVCATPSFLSRTEAALDLQRLAAQRLREDCVRALEKRVHSEEARTALVGEVFDDLGALVQESLVASLSATSTDALTRRLNALERRVDDALKPSGGTAAEALRALLEVAAASPHGRSLAAAELFIQMTTHDHEHLANVLTAQPRAEVWLDASVALPVLCGRLDRVAGGWATSEIAVELHGALTERAMKVVVPNVYVEEMAAHLLQAARSYAAVIGQDEDLGRSENFYVAHFHSVARQRSEPATPARFLEFLEGVGLPAHWKDADRSDADFLSVRRKIERSVENHLRRYGIGLRRLKSSEAVPLPGEPARTETVLRHDRLIVRDLEGLADSDEGAVLCSEDRWFIEVLTARNLVAMHPSAFLDLLVLVRPGAESRRLASVREFAATFSERVAHRGATVWDALAELEGERLADWQLLQRARAFKADWLRRHAGTERPRAADWQRFKAALSATS